jgi:predicted ATP-dependent endonuclease of OLD family
MWALLDGSETILLEEPELYLHAAIVKQLPEFISKLQRRKGRKRQVIITTHSYDLLSSEGIGAEEVIVLQTTREGTTAKTAESISEIKPFIESGFTMAEAVLPTIAPKRIENILQLKIYE